MDRKLNAQELIGSYRVLIDETCRHFSRFHSKEDFMGIFGMPEWLADHNAQEWEYSGIKDLRERAAWQLFEKIDNDYLVNYISWLANDRKWYGSGMVRDVALMAIQNG